MKKFNLFLILSVTFAVIACKKENSGQTDETTMKSMATTEVAASTLYDDAFNEVMTVSDDNGLMGKGGSLNTCATVTVSPADPATFPKTITLDYGTTGCTSQNGITRKGKIIYTMTSRFRTTGAVISISFENYSANDYQLQGTYSLTNNGTGAGLNLTATVTNGQFILPDGSTYTYSGSKTVAQTAGVATTDISDDEFSITGQSSLTAADGTSVTVTIQDALLKKTSCEHIVSGKEQIRYNMLTGILNFGDGTCDDTATLTIGNNSQVITLP